MSLYSFDNKNYTQKPMIGKVKFYITIDPPLDNDKIKIAITIKIRFDLFPSTSQLGANVARNMSLL